MRSRTRTEHRLRGAVRRVWHTEGLARWILLVGLVVTAVFVVFAVFAPWLAPYGFDQNSADGVRFPKSTGPGPGHLLGTNDQFYDIFSRVVWGARTALLVVVLSVVLSALIGVLLGLVSGYLGGWFDRITVFLMDALYSFPSLLLAIVFSFMLRERIGGSILAAALSLTAIYIPQYYRVVRNTTVGMRQATFVEAAEALGAGRITMMRRYLLPNVTSSVPVIGTLNAADALGTLAALGFLGLGIPPNEASDWGYDLSRALDDVAAGDFGPALWPGLAIILLVTALTLVGEGLSETLNPTLRRPRRPTVVLPPRTEES